ncbi:MULTISPECIES: hypothetical protein [Lentzea]|uniref:hypothetical protein n=1 Tax=Lentzea TaxID=165301 RepID=UPI001472DE80|nr:hypothetical protein [Lentzea atacamensis]
MGSPGHGLARVRVGWRGLVADPAEGSPMLVGFVPAWLRGLDEPGLFIAASRRLRLGLAFVESGAGITGCAFMTSATTATCSTDNAPSAAASAASSAIFCITEMFANPRFRRLVDAVIPAPDPTTQSLSPRSAMK